MESRVSQRYAKALLDLALEKGQLEQVREDVQLISTTVRESRELHTMLKSPVIKTDKKLDVLQSIFGGKIGVITSTFLDHITRKHREGGLAEISDSFLTLYKKHKQILTAVITTANGIDDATRKKVMEVVKGSSSSEIELVEKLDPSLIGGFVLRVGDKQVDASIIRQIRNLDRGFSENPFVKEI